MDASTSSKRNLPLQVGFTPAAGTKGPFFAELIYSSSGVENRVRIGTGGNVYSWLRGGTELLPPQANPFSRWVDDVFQITLSRAGEGELLRQGPGKGFVIHQAGTYSIGKDASALNYYSPVLACDWDDRENELYIVSWPQSAHLPSKFRSEVLLLTRYRRISETLLEVAHLALNFGDMEISRIGFPWGGVRPSIFPDLAQLEGQSFRPAPRTYFGERQSLKMSGAHGAVVWSQSSADGDASAFGVAFPLFGSPASWKARYGIAGNAQNWSRRDFYVFTSVANIDVPKGALLTGAYLLGAGSEPAVQRDLLSETAKQSVRLRVDADRAAVAALPTLCSRSAPGGSRQACDIETTGVFAPGLVPIFQLGAGSKPIASTDVYKSTPSGDGYAPWQRSLQLDALLGLASVIHSGASCSTDAAQASAPADEVCKAKVR